MGKLTTVYYQALIGMCLTFTPFKNANFLSSCYLRYLHPFILIMYTNCIKRQVHTV